MRVQIPYLHLDDNQEPHVTVAAGIRFQIALLEGAAAPGIPADSAAIEWLICRRSGPHTLEFRCHDMTLGVLDFRSPRFELPNLIGIIVPGEESESRALQERWAECFPAVELDFIALPRPDVTLILRAALDAVGKKLLSQRAFSGRAALDLAVYRREFERLQRAFSRLEEFVSRRALEAPAVLFEYPALAPSGGGSSFVRAGDTEELRPLRLLQALPIDSLGVAGFAVHIRTQLPAGSKLRATLHAIESDRTYGIWCIEAGDIAPGWLHLTLGRAIDEPALSLEVGIELPLQLDHSSLALGHPHPYEDFCARVDGGEILRAPLALRIFGCLPGVRVPGVSGAFAPTNAARPPLTFVPHAMLAGTYQVAPPSERDRNKFVIYDAASGNVTVHPHEGGRRTIARVDLAVPPDAWCLSAEIALEHELANPTQFALSALALIAKGADGEVIETLEENGLWFSGWIELAALERKKISVLIPPGEARVLSVYMLTQQAPEASADYAWARFENFTFNSLPRAMARNAESSQKLPVPERADVAPL